MPAESGWAFAVTRICGQLSLALVIICSRNAHRAQTLQSHARLLALTISYYLLSDYWESTLSILVRVPQHARL